MAAAKPRPIPTAPDSDESVVEPLPAVERLEYRGESAMPTAVSAHRPPGRGDAFRGETAERLGDLLRRPAQRSPRSVGGGRDEVGPHARHVGQIATVRPRPAGLRLTTAQAASTFSAVVAPPLASSRPRSATVHRSAYRAGQLQHPRTGAERTDQDRRADGPAARAGAQLAPAHPAEGAS